MAQIKINNLYKRYDRSVVALENINLEIQSGEFLVLVGPSGCGKSTLLRCVAGLENPSVGIIEIQGQRVDCLPPAERGIGMVFQDYALYPHMNVEENLAFGLKLRKVSKQDIHQRIQETASMLGLIDLLKRKPSQLSGGQRQRVAIGRALVKRPKVLLLDEPLSNLDPQLRIQTRLEIAALHRRIQSTILYVTHDQEEAMTLANRIAVLRQGKIDQVGSPLEIYQSPVNQFVASFIGSPAMNFLQGNLKCVQKEWIFETYNQRIYVTPGFHPTLAASYILGFRPEHSHWVSRDFNSSSEEASGATSKAFLNMSFVGLEFHGYEIQVIGRIGDQTLILRTSDSKAMAFFQTLSPTKGFSIQLNLDHLHWFEPVGIRQRIQSGLVRSVA